MLSKYIFMDKCTSTVRETVVRESYITAEHDQQIQNSVKHEGNIEYNIFLLSMSSCEPCKKAKKYLTDRGISFDYIDVDAADMDDWDRALEIMGDNIPSQGMKMIFPMIIIDGIKVIQGFSETQIENVLHI